jgi:hypothetical protein
MYSVRFTTVIILHPLPQRSSRDITNPIDLYSFTLSPRATSHASEEPSALTTTSHQAATAALRTYLIIYAVR